VVFCGVPNGYLVIIGSWKATAHPSIIAECRAIARYVGFEQFGQSCVIIRSDTVRLRTTGQG